MSRLRRDEAMQKATMLVAMGDPAADLIMGAAALEHQDKEEAKRLFGQAADKGNRLAYIFLSLLSDKKEDQVAVAVEIHLGFGRNDVPWLQDCVVLGGLWCTVVCSLGRCDGCCLWCRGSCSLGRWRVCSLGYSRSCSLRCWRVFPRFHLLLNSFHCSRASNMFHLGILGKVGPAIVLAGLGEQDAAVVAHEGELV